LWPRSDVTTIPMEQFPLRRRLTDPKHRVPAIRAP